MRSISTRFALVLAVLFGMTTSQPSTTADAFLKQGYQETGRSRHRRNAASAARGGSNPNTRLYADIDEGESDSYYSTGAEVGAELQVQVDNHRHAVMKDAKTSECWSEAVSALGTSCSAALQDRGYKGRLALHFLHCQFQFDQRKEQHAVAECLEHNPISNPLSSANLDTAVQTCLGNLDKDVYSSYKAEVLYVDSMCQFLQNTNFRQNMDQMVQNMAVAGKDATRTLFDILKKTYDLGNGITKISESQEKELDHLAKVLTFLLEHTRLAEQHQITLGKGEEKLNNLGDAMSLLHSLQLNFSTAQQKMVDHLSAELEAHSGKLTLLNDNVETVNTGVSKANAASLQLQDSQAAQVRELLQAVGAMNLLNERQQEAAKHAETLLLEVEGVQGSVGGLKKSFKDLEGATEIIERVVTLLTEKQESFFSTLDKVLEVLRRLEYLTGDVSGAVHILFSMILYCTLFFMTFLASLHKRLAHGKGGLLLTVAATFGIEVTLWLQGSKAIRLLAATALDHGSSSSNLGSLPFLALIGSYWPGARSFSHAAGEDDTSTFGALDLAMDHLKQGQWVLRYVGLVVLVVQVYRTASRYKTSEERMMEVVRKAIRLENGSNSTGEGSPATTVRSSSARNSRHSVTAVSSTAAAVHDVDETSSQASETALSDFDAGGESMEAPGIRSSRSSRGTEVSKGSSSKRASSSRKGRK